MKFSITQEMFTSMLDKTIGVVNPKVPVAAAQNLYLKAEKKNGLLRMRATDITMNVEARAVAKVEDSGDILVPARMISDVVQSLGTDILNFEDIQEKGSDKIKREGLEMKAGRSRSRIFGMKGSLFPMMNPTDEPIVLTLNCGQLKMMIDRCLKAVPDKDDRPILLGLNLSVESGKLVAVSTDGFRMARDEHQLDQKLDVENPIVVTIPKASVRHMRKLIHRKQDDEGIDIKFHIGHVAFDTGSAYFISMLLAGDFPKHTQQMVPDHPAEQVATVSLSEFKDALGPGNAVAKGNEYRNYKIYCNAGKMYFRTDNDEKGFARNYIDADIKSSFKIAVNQRYLREALNSFNSTDVLISATSNTGPVLLRDPALPHYAHVLMPMFVDFDEADVQLALA